MSLQIYSNPLWSPRCFFLSLLKPLFHTSTLSFYCSARWPWFHLRLHYLLMVDVFEVPFFNSGTSWDQQNSPLQSQQPSTSVQLTRFSKKIANSAAFEWLHHRRNTKIWRGKLLSSALRRRSRNTIRKSARNWNCYRAATKMVLCITKRYGLANVLACDI